ncbi:MAG: hypothetical protein V7L29_29450 [Nostoc sp.]
MQQLGETVKIGDRLQIRVNRNGKRQAIAQEINQTFGNLLPKISQPSC